MIQPRGLGGDLANVEVITQLDAVAAEVEPLRGLPIGNTPYDGATGDEQRSVLAARWPILHDPAQVAAEEAALKRLGLLPADANLAALLDQLYGQALPVAYLETRGRRMSILESLGKLSVADRGEAAREFGRAAVDMNLGIANGRVGDLSQGDQALAVIAVEQGDGTAVLLDWVRGFVGPDNQGKALDVVVPGDDAILGSMPPLLRREYEFPFLEGRAFVDALRAEGGWGTVDAVWRGAFPLSTEQVMHPKRYPGDAPVRVERQGIAETLGAGWSEAWQQTMGELRIGVWLADGQPGTQAGPAEPVELPGAGAAGGWRGDRLISLAGPDGTWAIVWQTDWDSAEDAGQFASAAASVMVDLPGARSVDQAAIAGGLAAPVLVLVASDDATLATVRAALGLGV